ncbi:cytochrome c oxidase subunit 3 [Wolbachia endosymbiont of Mansonella perstans]|nr:cytochrome c oxidase subunit 3 [Wolbachia endosymbiont of Mansonella perstans]
MFGFGILGIDVSLALFISMGCFFSIFICFLYIIYVSFLWLKDVILEDVSGQYSFYDYRIFNQGFRLFLFSELALFFSIFWTYLDSSLCSLT